MSNVRSFAAALAALVLCLLLSSAPASAQGPAPDVESRIIVLPFEINAESDLGYLVDALPEQLAQKLRERGLSVVDPKETRRLVDERGVKTLDLASARNLALLSGAAYAVYGSLSQVGQNASIDARLVDAFAAKPAVPLFVVKDVSSILPAVEELADKVKGGASRQGRISSIDVEGTQVLEKDVVMMRMKIQPGDSYDPKAVDEELRRIYGTGYFDDVQVRTVDTPEGIRLVVQVKEKPRIQAISIKGNDHLSQDDILQAMSTKTGAVMNMKVLSEDLGKIRELYRKDGYYKADVSYQLEGGAAGGPARLVIVVSEGGKLYIKKIAIEGAKKLSEGELKDQLALAERGWLSWLTGSGVLKEELLDRDAAALEAYYGNRGFMDVKIGQPDVDFRDDGIYVTFRVQEGDRYKIRSVDYAGDLLVDTDRLRQVTKLDDLAADGKFYDRSVVREDMQALSDFYTDFGYAKAEADIKLDKNEADRNVGVTYVMSKHQKVYIRRVTIEGNEKTRDNVIRRQMRLTDGSMFSGTKLRRSNERLSKLDYFDKVEIEPVPTGDPNEIDLKVKVKEKPTGQLSAGAGYSSFDGPFVTGMIMERNLFGKGYELGFSGTFGGRTTQYRASFTNPNVFDTPLAAGADAYIIHQKLFDYQKDTTGARARFGYPLGEYSKLFWNYRLEHYTIHDIDEDLALSSPIWDMEGSHWASVASASLQRDTTDKRINPSRGSVNTITAEYGGGALGGDDEFIKTVLDTSWYWPLFWKSVFHWHAQAGYVTENGGGKDIPLFERFYLGGMNNVRGYSGNRIAPRDDDGTYIGGVSEFFTNFEVIFPIHKELGLMGVTFFDAGNTWDEGQSPDFDLYKSVGVGLRWYSPLGPLRLEYGYGLDKLDNSSNSRVEFSVGQFF